MERGAPINTVDFEGKNALHHKIMQLKDVIERFYCLPFTEEEIVVKVEDFCKVRLENGADINIKDRNGKTVLDTAAEIDSLRVREALLKLFLSHLDFGFRTHSFLAHSVCGPSLNKTKKSTTSFKAW